MDWSKGFSTSHYMTIVDPISWKDIDVIQIENGTINHGNTSLIESADFTCEHVEDSIFDTEQWIRVYADIRQDEDSYHGALFTGLACSPSRTIEGTMQKDRVQCYSVLKPAEDILLDRGYFVPAKSEVSTVVSKLLSVSSAPIRTNNVNGELLETLVAESNETNLSMAWKLLDLMGWTLRISGDGVITIDNYPKIADYKKNEMVLFNATDSDSLETSISVDYDKFNCPNVFRAVHNSSMAIARDEDPNSSLSIQNRGREVWMEETDCTLKTNESLGDYAKRRLKEEQNVAYGLNYTRRYHPEVNVYDIIQLNYPAQNIVGYYKVESQTMTLGYSIAVSENVNKVT